jgi:hypothetical protein
MAFNSYESTIASFYVNKSEGQGQPVYAIMEHLPLSATYSKPRLALYG